LRSYGGFVKALFFSILFLCGGGNLAAYVSPVSYSDAQDQLAQLSLEANTAHKALKEKIKTQSSSYEVLNRLSQAKISVEEMIQRDNIAKACKVVDVGFTAVGIVTGGAAVVAKEGGKAALKWVAGKAAVEGAKEAAGVPGYSDAVKVGTYIFNKADQNELGGQLSRDNIEILLKARQLIQDESDGRTLKDKLPELRQMIFDMESEIEKNDYQLKYLSNQLDEMKKKGDFLNNQAAIRKEEEKKNAEKTAEKMKKIEASGLVDTNITRPAEVPPAPIGPKDDPVEKKRKIQESIDNYIKSLKIRINSEAKAAEDAWNSFKKPEGLYRTARYDGTDEVKDILYSLIYLEESLTASRTYSNMQSLENSAGYEADHIKKYREYLENRKNEIKTRIEPLITNISGYTAQWKSVYDTYRPLGFYVSEPENVKNMTLWTSYYASPLKYIEVYTTATEGLESRFRNLSSKAAGEKDAIYAEARSFAESYAAKLQGFKDYKPQVVSQLRKITEEFAKKAEVVNALPYDFVTEFSYDGKYDLADLEARIAAAKPAFSAMEKASGAGTVLYNDLLGRFTEINAMSMAPLMTEASTIRYMAENKAHKDAMDSILKKTAEYSPDLSGTEGWQSERISGAALMFGAEDALKYLKKQSDKLVSAYGKAISEFKNNTSKDLAYLEKMDSIRYAAEIAKIFEPSQRADEETRAIIEEVRKAPLFGSGSAPLLERTGFWTKQAGIRRDELEKTIAAFWDSPAGKALTEARRIKELAEAQDKRDPGLAIVKKMYENFENAYESRNAAGVMSFVSDDWSAGDGVTAADLNEQFTRIFRLFDEISVELSNLQIVGDGNGIYTASYNMAIRSRIYRKNIKREETSSVYEHVEVNGNSARIKKTEAGGYWSIK